MKKCSFDSIALIIWILTVSCKVSNGLTWGEDRQGIMNRFKVIYGDLADLKAKDEKKDQEIKSLKLVIEELKLQVAPKSELEGINSKFQSLIEKMKSETKSFEKWTTLVTVQETCAQLGSLTGLINDGKKEWIDPDGRSTGNFPIEVRILLPF